MATAECRAHLRTLPLRDGPVNLERWRGKGHGPEAIPAMGLRWCPMQGCKVGRKLSRGSWQSPMMPLEKARAVVSPLPKIETKFKPVTVSPKP